MIFATVKTPLGPRAVPLIIRRGRNNTSQFYNYTKIKDVDISLKLTSLVFTYRWVAILAASTFNFGNAKTPSSRNFRLTVNLFHGVGKEKIINSGPELFLNYTRLEFTIVL